MIHLTIDFIFVITGMYFLAYIAPTMEPPVKPGFIMVPPEKIEPEIPMPWWAKVLIYGVVISVYEAAQIFPIVGWVALGIVAAGMLFKWADDLYLGWKERRGL